MSKTIAIWVGVFALTGLVLWGLIALQQRPAVSDEKNENVSTIKQNDWVRGERTNKAVLVEYGDFQCPACREYEALLKQLSDEIGSQFVLVYRHFPLTQHKQAFGASQASEAAGLQGKFWEMHDLLYEKQSDWSLKSDANERFLGYAKGLGLNEAKFISDFDSEAVKQRVESDLVEAQNYRISSTPTFFLNGFVIKPTSYDNFKQLIQDAAGS